MRTRLHKGFFAQLFRILGEIVGVVLDIILTFFMILLKILKRFWVWESRFALLLFVLWGFNYLAPSTSKARADLTQPFQAQVVVTLPMKVTPNLQVRDIVLSLVRIEFGADQVNAFDNIVTHESGWSPEALNGQSGACGLFQALPCSKMASMALQDQIDFGLNYIKNRYGTPVNAWAFWQTHHWY